MQTQIEKIKEIGLELGSLREEINTKEEAFEKEMFEKKQRRDSLQEMLFNELKSCGIKSIKSDNGYTFLIASKKGVNITNQDLAMKWAIKVKAMRPDMKIIEGLLKASDELPKGFEFVEKEYISIRKPKEDTK